MMSEYESEDDVLLWDDEMEARAEAEMCRTSELTRDNYCK